MSSRLRSLPLRVGIVAAGSVVIALSMLVFALGAASPTEDREVRSLSGMRLVSYYPAEASWSRMWEAFDEEAIDADFARTADLGFTTVRIFVQPQTIGYPTPNPVMAAKVRRTVELADAHGLTVALALFDRFLDYGDVKGSKAWLDEILAPYADDDRIQYVELQNEINPATEGSVAWARALMPRAQQLAGSAPVVISVPGSAGVAGLQALSRGLQDHQPAAYGFHYYRQPAYLRGALESAMRAVAPVPVFLGEVGFATNPDNESVPGTPPTSWAQEGRQELQIRAALSATRALGMPSAGIWTLNDFDLAGIPEDMTKARARSENTGFGLLRRNGSLKPAAVALQRYFDDGVLDTDLNLGFERHGDVDGRPLPLYWRVFGADRGTISVDTHESHSGAASARLEDTGSGGADAVPALSIDPANLQVVPGHVYETSAWVKLQAATGGNRIGISWFDADERFLDQKESPWLPAGDLPWTRIQFGATAPPGAVAMKVYLKSTDNTGVVWFDDVEIG